MTFTFDYSNNAAGVGFLDASLGATRQAALNSAATAFSAMYGTYFSNSGNIVMSVTSSDDSLGSTLMSAGTFYTSTSPGFGTAEVVLNKLRNGTDINGADADGQVDVNWGHLWDTSGSTTIASGAFDFYAALFHEFTHALGFASGFDTDPASATFGQDLFGDGLPGGAQGSFSAYDQFVTNCSGGAFVDATLHSNPGVISAAATSNVCFNGANAMAAYGGNQVDLYAPSTYSAGSSVSHLNSDNPSFVAAMMRHDRDTGLATRTYNGVEVGILADVGYSLTDAGRELIYGNSVPEPGTLVLMMLGLSVGAAARRRKAV